MIEYVNVHKAFDVPVLAGVDLTVETGEILAIVGPSGTGKSVLLKTTIGLIVPDRGDVRINGDSVYAGGAQKLQAVRQKVGYVFQYAALFDSMNVFENVAFGLPDDEVRASP
jgi:phospholipid/cholesterol/gamma-HCH transport system ATP-binding protein